MVLAELHELVRLHRAGQDGSAVMQRHAIVPGTLVTRLLFEVYELPQAASAAILAA